jgi:ATP-dependent DNA helicase RecG
MNAELLRQLIQQGETLDIEFKSESQKQLSDDEIVRAVVCMANRASAQSGWLLIGVEDNGQPTGARPRHEQTTDPLRLQALIANRTRPSLSVQVHLVPLHPEGVEIIAIEVPPVRVPVGTTDGVYLRRAIGGRGLPECVPMHFHDMQLLCCNDTPADYRHPPRKVNAHTKRTQQQKNCGASCTPHPSPTPHDAPNATPDYAHHPQTCA